MPKTIFRDRAVDTVLSVGINATDASPNLDVGDVTNWPVPAAGEDAIAWVGFGTATMEPVRYTGVDAVNGILTGTSRIAALKVAHNAGERVVNGGDSAFLESLVGKDLAQTISKRLAIDPTDGVPGIPHSVVIDRAATNLITNPSFEVDLTGWEANPTAPAPAFSRQVVLKFIGDAALRIDHNSAADFNGVRSVAIAVNSGQMYAASFWFRTSAAPAWRAQIHWFDSAGAFINADPTLDRDGATGWTRHVITGVAPANAVTARVYFVNRVVAQGVYSVYIDGVQFEEGGLSTYCDGSLGPGYSWSGTPHASSSSRTAGLKVLGRSVGDSFALGAGRLLAVVRGTGPTSYSTSATSFADVDTSKLVISFAAPASGKVMVIQRGGIDKATTDGYVSWNLREGSADVPNTDRNIVYGVNDYHIGTNVILLSGLVPGQVYTYKWGWKTANGTAYLSNSSISNSPVMEAWEVPV